MLELTETAATAIRAVVEANELPETAGLRITSEAPSPDGMTALTVDLAEEPAVEDEVVETSGARVFLDPDASGHLDDMVLDAEIDDSGSIRFGLGQQA
jgi:Fe-S cluster assembly iron-binding protein IscA